jgi:FtsP/CotA-like multicopper oxidase with cupredoxin domain
MRKTLLFSLLVLAASPAAAQSFRVQCPERTTLHPDPLSTSHGQIKCQQISGGDGFATMGDGTQTYLFAFGPLSGLTSIANGQPGTLIPSAFNIIDPGTLAVGDPATSGSKDPVSGLWTFPFNGAVGLVPDPESTPPGLLNGHVDPRPIMDVGVMNGNLPAPMMAIDEDDEFFLTLTNVGMIMRPDLFEQHTVHFHGYANAAAYYDGVPDASVAINIGGSMTYYYLAPEAGTYFWHCHVTPPEHLQMGMVGQIYVRPRQNRVNGSLRDALITANLAAKSADGLSCSDILCSSQTPAPAANTATNNGAAKYAYNDGDGSTRYDVEYPIQIHGFDPNFHFVGMTFNPEPFTDQKDKYFLLNGRSYPDTMTSGPMKTQSSDGTQHFAQPVPTIVNIPRGGRALLRLSSLDTMEYQTLASLGIPMRVIAQNARLLRDMAGNDLTYVTNSITLGGGESIDVILDASGTEYAGCTTAAPCTYYLYTPNLDHLSNDAENFGGLMTEVTVCGAIDPTTKVCN